MDNIIVTHKEHLALAPTFHCKVNNASGSDFAMYVSIYIYIYSVAVCSPAKSITSRSLMKSPLVGKKSKS